MSMYLMYGHAGTSARAVELARTEGVHWAEGLGGPDDLIVVEPLGLVRLMAGGGARQSDTGGTVLEQPGEDPLVLWPMACVEEGPAGESGPHE